MMRAPSTKIINGFTLVELIAIIIIVGVLSVMVIPRFISTGSVSPISAQAQVIAAARRAQQIAMNRGTGAGVIMTTDNGNKRVRVTYSGSGSPLDFDLPGDISITVTNISYDSIGTPYSGGVPLASTLTISIANGTSRQVCIEPTGYAHGC